MPTKPTNCLQTSPLDDCKTLPSTPSNTTDNIVLSSEQEKGSGAPSIAQTALELESRAKVIMLKILNHYSIQNFSTKICLHYAPMFIYVTIT